MVRWAENAERARLDDRAHLLSRISQLKAAHELKEVKTTQELREAKLRIETDMKLLKTRVELQQAALVQQISLLLSHQQAAIPVSALSAP